MPGSCAPSSRPRWAASQTRAQARVCGRFDHAAQQRKAALDAGYGEISTKGQALVQEARARFLEDSDSVERVIRALVYLRNKHPRKKRIGEVLRYLRRNRHRMRYAETEVQNVPVGSGIVGVQATLGCVPHETAPHTFGKVSNQGHITRTA